ncbi:MAG: ATP-binding protein [Rikenellaceae bacterium]
MAKIAIHEILRNSAKIMITIIILLCLSIVICVYLILKHKKDIAHLKFDDKLISALPGSIFVLNNDKYIIDIINITPAAMFGFSKNDIIGKNITVFTNDINSPFQQACSILNDVLDRIIVNKQTETFRYMIGDAYLEAITKPLDNGYILCMVRDITKSTEEIHGMMKKKQNEIEVALNAGGLTSWSYDVETKLFNSMIDNDVIYGSTYYDELLNKLVDKEDRNKVLYAFNKIINKESSHCEFTVRSTTKYNEKIWVNIHAVPNEYDSEGNVKTIIGSQKNITKEVNAMNELIRLRKKAEESNILKSAFISNMSHEIRTPLNAIVGFSGLVASTDDKEEAAEYIKLIEQNNNLLLNIINDILDLSKIEADKINFTFTEIDIPNLLKGLSMSTALKAHEGVEILVDKIDPDITLTSDINRISQVLSNFLNNAVKFTSKGSISLGCKRQDNGNVCLYVQDTGIGIKEENITKIFDRFVKLNDFIQGTGLGLSICETIASRLGGEIGVVSEFGKGSKFWIEIPENYKMPNQSVTVP